ncbi:MAG: xanthine dehydrogenase family protein [Burkholderiales bacterium]|nr:xanthine dehydrogenase family protein [Burkholderiales bacterium]
MSVRDTRALREAAALRAPVALPPRRFLGDASAPGLLHAAVLRGPHPHARLVSVSLDAARRLPGVHAVISGADLPTAHRLGIQVRDRPALAVGRVRHVGEPVAAVAAETLQIARDALAAIEVRWAPLPTLDDPERALAADAPALHEGGNLLHATRFERGDLEAAFARAAHVVESVVSTPRQVHAYLELESALAVPREDGTLHVLAPCQGPHAIRQDLAALLGWPVERIEVTGSPLGGSYGGKDDMHGQAIAALLAVRCGRPVRLAWSRAESMAAGMKRHPFVVRMRTGCDAEGRLLAHDVSLLLDTGAYASHGPEVLDTAHEHAPGAYRWEALRVEGRLAYTNNGISGAFRGFGALQTSTALELQIDALARRAGIDPMAFRTRNLLRRDDPGPLGQAIAPLPDLHAVMVQLEAIRAESSPAARSDPLPAARTESSPAARAEPARWALGRGCALVTKSEGFAVGGPNAAGGRLGRLADGTVELRVGLSEMGQGLSGAARDLLRAALDAQPELAGAPLRTSVGLTERTPSAGPTSASRGTHILAKLVAALVPKLAAACAAPGASGELWVEAEVAMPESFSAHGPAHAIFGACGAFAEVSVDRWTGRVRVDRVTVVPSVGPVVSPAGFLSQIEGSVPMAAGFVVLEDLPAEAGRFRATNLDGYLVPTLADAPRVALRAIDAPIADDDALPRGIGESALNAIAPAIANALADAAGAMPDRLPVSPAWLRDALDARAARDGGDA